MPTRFYFRTLGADSDYSADDDRKLSDLAGGTNATNVTNSTAAGAIQITGTAGGTPFSWWSNPLAAQELAAQTLTVDLWGLESNAMANQGFRIVVDLYNNDGSVHWATILDLADTVELGTAATNRVFSGTTLPVTVAANDRLRVRLYVVEIGSGSTGYTVSFQYNNAEGGQFDSQIRFTNDVAYNTGTTLAPTPVVVPAVLPVATLERTLALSPTAVAVPVALPPATLGQSSDTTLTPTPVAAAVGLPTASVSSVNTLAPTATAVSVAVPAATIEKGAVSLAPSAVVAPALLPTPSLDRVLILTPTAVVAPVGLPTPSVASVYTLSPAPTAVAAALPMAALDRLLSLAPGAVQVVLGLPPAILSLSETTLAPSPVVVSLALPVGSLNRILTLSPAVVGVSFISVVPVLGSVYEVSPGPVVVPVGLPSAVLEKIRFLEPTAVAVSLMVPQPSVVGGTPVIVSGSDHQLIVDSIEFYVAYDAESDPVVKSRMLRDFLLEHGGKMRKWNDFLEVRGGFYPIRYE